MKSKLDSHVAERMFMLYRKSDKQYYVMSQESNRISDLKLVTNPEFCEWEDEYCKKALANSHGLAAIGSETAWEIEPAQFITEIEKHQQIMPVPASNEASATAEREKNNETLWEERASPASKQVNNEAEQTSDESADDPHDDNTKDVDAMEMDDDDDDDDGEKDTLQKTFLEQPSRTQLEEKKKTLKKATPGQSSEAEDQSYHPAMESSEEWSHTQCIESANNKSEQWCSDKIEEYQNKITSQTVNDDKEQTDIL